jgi:hypothetical protein
MSARWVGKRANRRTGKRLAENFPSWTITYSGSSSPPPWKATCGQGEVTVTLCAHTAWQLRAMIVVACEPAGDDTGVVPVMTISPGGEPLMSEVPGGEPT